MRSHHHPVLLGLEVTAIMITDLYPTDIEQHPMPLDDQSKLYEGMVRVGLARQEWYRATHSPEGNHGQPEDRAVIVALWNAGWRPGHVIDT